MAKRKPLQCSRRKTVPSSEVAGWPPHRNSSSRQCPATLVVVREARVTCCSGLNPMRRRSLSAQKLKARRFLSSLTTVQGTFLPITGYGLRLLLLPHLLLLTSFLLGGSSPQQLRHIGRSQGSAPPSVLLMHRQAQRPSNRSHDSLLLLRRSISRGALPDDAILSSPFAKFASRRTASQGRQFLFRASILQNMAVAVLWPRPMPPLNRCCPALPRHARENSRSED